MSQTPTTAKKKKFSMPDTYVIVSALVIVACILT